MKLTVARTALAGLIVVGAGLGMGPSGLAQSPQEEANRIAELRTEVRNKAVRCAQAEESACAEVCANAVRSFSDGGVGDAALIGQCRALAAPSEGERATVLAGHGLKADDWVWVGDVEGEVVGRRLRSLIKVSDNDNADWATACGSEGVASGTGVSAEMDRRMVVGSRVRLKFVQRDTAPETGSFNHNRCLFGEVEILDPGPYVAPTGRTR